MSKQDRIELLKAVAECAPKEMGAEYSDRTYDVGDISNPACYLTGIVSFTELPDGSPLCLVSQPPYSTLDGDACFAMLDAMRKRESELTQLVATHSDKELRAMAYEHAASELFRVRAVLDELTWRNLSAEAVSRAFVTVFGGGK